MGTGVLSRGKAAGSKVNHSPSSSVNVKNEWNYTSGPLYIYMARAGTSLPWPLSWEWTGSAIK
jgi:hypothetical protein